MSESENLFSQIFETMYALRSLTFTYFTVVCAVSIFDTWHPDSWATLAFFAVFGSIFGFYFFCRLLGVGSDKQSLKLFGTFALWDVVINYVMVMGIAEFIKLIFDGVSGATPDSTFWYFANLLCIFVLGALPLVFLETVLPAKIFGVGDSISDAVRRASKNASYLLPRFIGVFLPIISLSVLLSFGIWKGGASALPISPEGELNFFTLLILFLSNFFGVLSEAVLMVITSNVYLMDLRKRGQIPNVEANVFS